ncbi:MAG: hypothetical protein AAFO06_08280 [Cyanobacteria bacterium J06597_16]
MATQRTLLDQAKQGNPDAIASLMNQTLAKQNRHIRVLRQAHQYKLLVEGEEVPPQAATVNWITQGLRKLAIPDAKVAIIYGKAKQSKQPEWQQSIQLETSNAQAAAPEPTATEATSTETIEATSTDTSTANSAQANQPQPTTEKPPEPTLDLTEYCFTRNKSLLKGNLTLPSKAVIQLVLSFHGLTNANKQEALPHIDKGLRKPEPIVDEALSPAAQTWLDQLPDLEGPDRRKASIWLSRYCLDPAATVDQLDVSSPVPEADTAEATDENQESEPSSTQRPFPTTHRHHSESPSAQPSAHQRANASGTASSTARPSLVNTNSLPLWVIPTVWSACLLIFIALGINSVKAADYGYPSCADTLGSPESCMLAVQLVGDDLAMSDVVESASPLMTPEVKERAIARCSNEGYFISSKPPMGTSWRPNHEDAITITASSTEELFPGVLLTTLTQTDSHADGATLRLACLDYTEPFEILDFASEDFATDLAAVTQGEQKLDITTDLISVEFDEIPENWPEEPYDGYAEIAQSFERFEGVYNVFVSFGANTLFTAIGLVIAVIWCACYRCHTLNDIYQTALVLGVVETVLSISPGIGLFASVAMEVLAIGITSRIVKGFDVDWTYGYHYLMLGAVTIMGVRLVLNTLMYSALARFIFI